MKFTPSKLFHAVVISGAALTGCAGTNAKPASPADASAAQKTTKPADKTQPASQSADGGVCPPGSERPYPPCYWIK